MYASMFPDLGDPFANKLVLPIGGKNYTIPPPPAHVGALFKAMQDIGVAVLAGKPPTPAQQAMLEGPQAENLDLVSAPLGTAYFEMVGDRIDYAMLRHAAMTALIYWLGNEEKALDFWQAEGNADGQAWPEPGEQGASTPNRNARRHPTKKAPTKPTKPTTTTVSHTVATVATATGAGITVADVGRVIASELSTP